MRVANGQQTTVRGFAMVDVVLNGKSETHLQLFVADYFPCLFGRPWIEKVSELQGGEQLDLWKKTL